MSKLQANLFQNEFPANNTTICNGPKGTKSILMDIAGSMDKNDIPVAINYIGDNPILTAKGADNSAVVVFISSGTIYTTRHYPMTNDHQDYTHELNWRNLRQVIIDLIQNA